MWGLALPSIYYCAALHSVTNPRTFSYFTESRQCEAKPNPSQN
jgi:hypothetical protein